jgi:hypothetical protein
LLLVNTSFFFNFGNFCGSAARSTLVRTPFLIIGQNTPHHLKIPIHSRLVTLTVNLDGVQEVFVAGWLRSQKELATISVAFWG